MMRLSSVNPQSQQALLSTNPLRNPDKLLSDITAIVLDVHQRLICDADDRA